MEEKNNQLEIKRQEEIVENKRLAWSDVGEVIHFAEIELQKESETIIASLVTPLKFEDVPKAEEALKAAKKKAGELQEQRKTTTDPLATVAARLMIPEKNVVTYFPAIEKAIIDLKLAKEKADKLIKAREEEFKRLRESVLIHVNNSDTAFRTLINNQVLFAYEYALGTGDIKEDTLKKYIEACKGKFKPEQLQLQPALVTLVNVTKEEYEPIFKELTSEFLTPQEYNKIYHDLLDAKFEFYNVALKNKEASLEQSKKEAAAAAEALAKDSAAKTTSANLSAMATSYTATATSETKPLKKSYALDMEETEQNSLLIIAAFVANYEQCKLFVRVTKAFELKVAQMAACLVAIKNKDERFACTGINFKEINKL